MPHWLARNERVRSPDCLVVFDTETRWSSEERYELHRPRCWAAICVIRHEKEPDREWVRSISGTSMADLSRTVDSWGRERKETWVYAHNVGFDLAISALPLHLLDLGWQVGDFWLGPEVSWLVFRAGDHKVVITDSFSWLPAALEDVARWMGKRKRRLPANDDDPEKWADRCMVDVELLATALLTVMDWWDAAELGSWSVTGAACGWRAARHMMRRDRILVGPDEWRTPFEREAIYGGRREAFVTGNIKARSVTDWDFVQAHATVAAEVPLPRRAGRHFNSLDPGSRLLRAAGYGAIARVRISTSVPLVPVKYRGEVWWPTGTFETVLCSPEISLALELADAVEIGEGWGYQFGWGLQDWGRWVLRISLGTGPEVPEVCRQVVKSWGRSVVGKFAQRSSRELVTRPATRPGWHYERGSVEDSHAEADIITLGGVERTIVRDLDGPDTFPAVFAFVESHTRAALTRTLLSRPEGSLIQCDTDGFLEALDRHTRPLGPPQPPPPFTMREKGRYSRIRVVSAQQVELDGERRMAGVSRRADLIGRDLFSWMDWPGLLWQISHSRPGTYTRTRRVVQLHGDKVRRWVLADGSTIPVEMDVASSGENVIVPWATTGALRGDIRLASVQHPELSGLV